MKTRLPFAPAILLLVMLLSFDNVSAQWITCVDSNRVNPFFNSCGPEYIPVCGCDGITYRNECSAYNIGGVNIGNITSGVCSDFEFDIIPTILSQSNGYLSFSLVFRDRGAAIILIMDLYGKLEYSYSVPEVHDFAMQFDPYQFRHGLHFIAVISKGERKVKKFIKMPEQ